MERIVESPVQLDWVAGLMRGAPIKKSSKTLGEMQGLFRDDAATGDEATRVLYTVQRWETVPPGTEGALAWGVTRIEPGRVGEEFFMTHGHFHANPSRGEYYGAVQGEGLLLLMDRSRRTWAERMSTGSLHAIDGRHAHRVINTGGSPLIFWACWPSDAGYDYEAIVRDGFGARVIAKSGSAILEFENGDATAV